jgi:hypothetical protein
MRCRIFQINSDITQFLIIRECMRGTEGTVDPSRISNWRIDDFILYHEHETKK